LFYCHSITAVMVLQAATQPRVGHHSSHPLDVVHFNISSVMMC